VNAYVLDTFVDHLLVALVGNLFVVHTPRIAADVLVGVVPDGVALTRLRLQRQRGVELVEPARLAWREDGMAEHST
jgi:hypothetical protein